MVSFQKVLNSLIDIETAMGVCVNAQKQTSIQARRQRHLYEESDNKLQSASKHFEFSVVKKYALILFYLLVTLILKYII